MPAQKQTRVKSTWFIIYILLRTAHIGLVRVLPYFPTQDGPSHIYNLVILNDLLHGGKEWVEYYSYEFKEAPNLGFNLIVYPLFSIVKPLFAEKLFLTIYIVLMGFSVGHFIRTFAPGKPLTIQLLAIPVIFNFTLMMGFYSYIIAVPVFLIALAFAWRIRSKPALLQFALYNLAGIVIFFLHLIPFIFFLISLVIIAVTDSRGKGSSVRLFIRRIAIMLPLVILLAFYLGSNKSSSLPTDLSYLLSASRFMLLFADLFTFSAVSLSPWQLLPAATVMFVVLVLMVWLAKDSRSDRLQLDTSQQTVLFLAKVSAFLSGLLKPDERRKLGSLFDSAFENNKLSVWKRR
jgi:hypothetical protein